jgi:hypothetical protein
MRWQTAAISSNETASADARGLRSTHSMFFQVVRPEVIVPLTIPPLLVEPIQRLDPETRSSRIQRHHCLPKFRPLGVVGVARILRSIKHGVLSSSARIRGGLIIPYNWRRMPVRIMAANPPRSKRMSGCGPKRRLGDVCYSAAVRGLSRHLANRSRPALLTRGSHSACLVASE